MADGSQRMACKGQGFFFAAVHDIQADVPPENIVAMWEAWWEFGRY